MPKTMYHFLVRKQPIREKCANTKNFIKYYFNFQKAVKLKYIYHNIKVQNKDFKNFVSELSKNDYEFFDSLFVKDVKKFLIKNKIETNIIPSEKIGLTQVGFNTIYVADPKSFWTTGHTTFFLPTKNNTTNNITMEISSIPEINVIIGMENEKIYEIKMPKFTEKTIKFSLNHSKIKNGISKFFITTDVLWKPDVLRNQKPKTVFGIRIDSIKITYS